MMSLPVWLPGPMFLPGGLCLWSHVPSIDRETPPGQTPPLDRDPPSGQRHPLDRDHPSWTKKPPPPNDKERAVRILLHSGLDLDLYNRNRFVNGHRPGSFFLDFCLFKPFQIYSLVDPRGRPLNFFYIRAVFEKKWANNRLTPPSLKLASLEILDPPLLSLFQVLDPLPNVALPVDLDLD